MPSVENVTVAVDGRRFSSWKSVSVSAAVKQAARSFRLEAACEIGASASYRVFRAGAKVEIYFNSDLVLTGYVDRYQPRISERDAQVSISGRSKSADLIDCAAEHPKGKGRFEEKNLKQIAETLDQFGVGVEVGDGVSLDQIEFHQIAPGETVFREIERLARSQGLAVMGRADGKIELTRGGRKRHAGGLIEGHNIKNGEADHNWSNRHSKYVVKGQRASGSTAENLEIEAVVKDEKVDRYRPTVIVIDGDTDAKRSKQYAEHLQRRAAGSALKATILVQGFRDDGGMVWEPNRLVWTESDFLQVTQDMLIESLTFTQDERGTVTRIELVDPRAYDGGSNGGRGKSGKRWGVNKSGSSWDFSANSAVNTTGETSGGVG